MSPYGKAYIINNYSIFVDLSKEEHLRGYVVIQKLMCDMVSFGPFGEDIRGFFSNPFFFANLYKGCQ